MARGKSSDSNKQVFWIILALVIAVLLFGGFLSKEQVTVEASTSRCGYTDFESFAWRGGRAKECEDRGCEVINKVYVDDPLIADDEGYWFDCEEKKYCRQFSCAPIKDGCVSVFSGKKDADGCPLYGCLTVCEGDDMDDWCSKITGGDNGNGDNGNGDNGNGDNGNGDNGNGGPAGGGSAGGGGDRGGFGPGPGDGGGGGGFDM